jgi:hypothetical protein
MLAHLHSALIDWLHVASCLAWPHDTMEKYMHGAIILNLIDLQSRGPDPNQPAPPGSSIRYIWFHQTTCAERLCIAYGEYKFAVLHPAWR